MVNHTAISLDLKKSKEIKYNITFNVTRPKCAETILNDGEEIVRNSSFFSFLNLTVYFLF